MLPIENTLGGSVQEVNDLLWEKPGLKVTGEYVHPVRHCLIGQPAARVTRAISHPQALAQTRHWLERHGIEPVPFHDTAGAVRHLAEHPDPHLAAIAGRRAAAIYKLQVLAEDIQDDDSNRTRFLVVRRGEPDRPGTVGGGKISLCFVAAHEPGSLVAALQCFASRQVNLTRLESRPIRERPFEYRFFVDAMVPDPNLAEVALAELKRRTAEVRIFGTYPPFGPI